MKLRYIAPILLVLAACKQTPHLELTIKADGITNGRAILKQAGEQAFNEPLKNGELTKNMQLQAPGYYSLTVIDNNKPITGKIAYDVYLENGNYTIQTNTAKPNAYPTITTTSATQKELSDYYQLQARHTAAIDHKIDSLTKYLESAEVAAMPKDKRAALYESTRAIQKDRRELDLKVLGEYANKHPQGKIGAHIMQQVYYPEYAKEYSTIFQKFPNEVQLSDDGLKIRNKLGSLLSQFSGAGAPEIAGTTADGKSFNKAAISKKIVLVEFWKPENETSQLFHNQLVKGIILTPADREQFEVVSVAITDNVDGWKNIIKNDGKPWQQLSDGKADQSPNVAAWEIKTLPMYFLVSKDWKMIKSNVPFNEIDTEVHDYLKKQK
ncbi:TlpA family protein disulfide reductase [Mucilaginibacter pedocola]|uniref:Uncharacterized protein n=1 Tax=Mucilaginibacter pedocola TaxID=1792845 RepID=A0A1S9P9M6_9SPHI|nr:thioredoxin-like domain-containing protein [Mucilaginibacter pedocola]OOQ57655.1 hypothetical protein BC343_12700 [Mucilaginibacter pedocola]